jgi:hypothetical protein
MAQAVNLFVPCSLRAAAPVSLQRSASPSCCLAPVPTSHQETRPGGNSHVLARRWLAPVRSRPPDMVMAVPPTSTNRWIREQRSGLPSPPPPPPPPTPSPPSSSCRCCTRPSPRTARTREKHNPITLILKF